MQPHGSDMPQYMHDLTPYSNPHIQTFSHLACAVITDA